MIGTVPAMPVVEHLVSPGLPLEPHHEDCLDAGLVPGHGACVDPLDVHAFRKQVELIHDGETVK